MAKTAISYALAAGILTPPIFLGEQPDEVSPSPKLQGPPPQYSLLRSPQHIQLTPQPQRTLSTVVQPVSVPEVPAAPRFIKQISNPTIQSTLPIHVPSPPPNQAIEVSTVPNSAPTFSNQTLRHPDELPQLPPSPSANFESPPTDLPPWPSHPVPLAAVSIPSETLTLSPPPLPQAPPVFASVPDIEAPIETPLDTISHPLSSPIRLSDIKTDINGSHAIPATPLPQKPELAAVQETIEPLETTSDTSPDLTVLLDVTDDIQISSTTPLTAYDSMSSEVLWETVAPLSIEADGEQVLVDGTPYPELLLSTSPDGIITADNTDYRGGLIIRAQQDELHVINHLSIEEVLYSQIGDLLDDDPTLDGPPLDAQVIAARTTALEARKEPAHLWYDIDGRTIAYLGTHTETASSIEAVEATQGYVISPERSLVLAEHEAL